MTKINWGVLSTAKIGREKVIPAMQQCRYGRVTAIASRNPERARTVADALRIEKAFGSYEELLSDPDIDAVYIPLPNHLHVEWTLKALDAGKHVLCEKPIALTLQEARKLADAAKTYSDLRVMEAFMYRHHPQWTRAKELVEAGGIGELRTIHSFFSYFNTDPENVRNQADIGGGGLMDIGCYCISLARHLFGEEPRRIAGSMEIDPTLGIDRLTSGLLEFKRGTSTFTCATQLSPHQRVHIFGTIGKIEIEIPFNAPPGESTRIWLTSRADIEEITFAPCDQYTIQGDLFSKAILDHAPVPVPLEDAVANMNVIEKLRESAGTGSWTAC
jgi:predicted dehydrogenase